MTDFFASLRRMLLGLFCLLIFNPLDFTVVYGLVAG